MVRFAGHYIKNNQYTKPMNRSVCTMGFVAFWREKKAKRTRENSVCVAIEKRIKECTHKKKHTNEWTEKQSQKLIFHKLRTKKKHDTQKKTRSIILFAPFFMLITKLEVGRWATKSSTEVIEHQKLSTTTTENAMNANLFSHYLELYRSESRKITIEIRFELIVCFINKCTFFSAYSCYLIVFFLGKMILGLKIWFS